MNSIRKTASSRTGFALASNITALVTALCFFRPYWEESDDIGMALLAEGAYGNHEPHLLYSNVVYGKVLCVLQQFIPAVRWHAVLMLLFAFIASTAFVYVLAKDTRGKILSAVYLVSMTYEVYVAMQFSKLSEVTAVCAFLILFECTADELSKAACRRLIIIATACGAFAFTVRLESFLLAAMIAGCYGICLVISEWTKGELVSKIRAYCTAFIPVFVIACILFAADLYSYSSGGWKDYKNYYDSVTNMTDYHYNALLYELHGDELEALGVSENDANMYITYESLEKDHTSLDLMDSISALDKKGIGYVNADLMKAWVANLYDQIFTLNSVPAGLVLMLGVLFISVAGCGDKRFYISNIVVQSVITTAVLFYYQYSSRYCHRVVYALLLAQLALTVYLLHTLRGPDIPGVTAVCVFMMLAFSVVTLRLGNEFEYREYERNTYGYDELISYMEQNKDTLFVADVFTMIDYGKYDIFRPGRVGQFDNFLQTDSVFVANSPVNTAISEKYGYADPFSALISGSDKVVLIDAVSPETELTFCNEHGAGGRYRMTDAGSVGGIGLHNIQKD